MNESQPPQNKNEIPEDLLEELKKLAHYRFLEKSLEREGENGASGKSSGDYDAEIEKLAADNPTYAEAIRAEKERLLTSHRKKDRTWDDY